MMKTLTIGFVLVIGVIIPQIYIRETIGLPAKDTQETPENVLWEEADYLAPESILIQDLDGDEVSEVIVGSHKDGLFVFNATGSFLWKYVIYSAIYQLFTYDITGDSFKEILFTGNQLIVLDCKGKLLWKYGGSGSDLLFEDIDGDSFIEIIYGQRNGITVFYNNGTIMWQNGGYGVRDIAITEFNGEKVILAVDRNGVTRMMSLLDGEMYIEWNQVSADKMPEGSDIEGILEDFNGDNFPDTILWEFTNYWIIDGKTREIIVQNTQGYDIRRLYFLEIDNDIDYKDYLVIGWFNITAYSHSGTQLWKVDNYLSLRYAIGDLNEDSYDDLMFSDSSFPRQIIAISGKDGSILWENVNEIDDRIRCSNLGDINNDDFSELAVGTGNGISGAVYLINGSTGKIIWNYETKPVSPVRDLGYLGNRGHLGINYSQQLIIAQENDNEFNYLGKGIVTSIKPGYKEIYWEQRSLMGASRILMIPDSTNDIIGEILVISTGGWIYLLNGFSGDIIWSFKFDESIILDTALLFDWNNDGIEEIFICTEHHLYIIESASGSILTDWQEDSCSSLAINDGLGELRIIIGQKNKVLVYNTAHELLWETSIIGIPHIIKVLNDQLVLVGEKINTSNESENTTLYAFSLDKGTSLWNQTNFGNNQISQIELINSAIKNKIFVRTAYSIVSLAADGKITMNKEYPRGVDLFTICDFNNDSYPDLAVLSAQSTVKIQIFDPDSGQEFFFHYYLGSERPTAILSADITGDKGEDIIVGSYSLFGGELNEPTYTNVMVYYGEEIELNFSGSTSLKRSTSFDTSSFFIFLCLIAIIVLPKRRKKKY